MGLWSWLFCGAVIYCCVVAQKIQSAKKLFRQHGLPIRARDIFWGHYYLVCKCGHPAYFLDYVGAGATFELHTLAPDSISGQPKHCHKCLRKMCAICVCGKIILPGDEVAIASILHITNYEPLIFTFLSERIICKECSEPLGEHIAYSGIYSPLATRTPYSNIIANKATALNRKLQPTHNAPKQIH